MGSGPGITTAAVALVTAVMWVPSLAWELLDAAGVAKKRGGGETPYQNTQSTTKLSFSACYQMTCVCFSVF